MKINAKYVMPIVALGLTFSSVSTKVSAADVKESLGGVIFKIHDIVPEKNADGNVIYCNIGATFFNRTKDDIANLAISLNWKDEVIGEIIDIEKREERAKKKNSSKGPKPRYSTSSFTSDVITVDIKLPPIKVNQQITLKTKVDTDRCFVLLNDMDVLPLNCGTLTSTMSKDACANVFQYVSPKSGEYYTEFKEISWENQIAKENEHVANLQNEVDVFYDETVKTLDSIALPISDSERNLDRGVAEDVSSNKR